MKGWGDPQERKKKYEKLSSPIKQFMQNEMVQDVEGYFTRTKFFNEYQKFAASQYLFYLLQEQNQDKAQEYGFRPANPSVPLNPEVFNEKNGVDFEIQVPIYRPMSGEAMKALFTVWPSVKNPGV